MVIKSITLLTTPFDNTYTDVLDVFDYTSKTEAQIKTSIKTFLINNYSKVTINVSGTAYRAENINDFSMKFIFSGSQYYEAIRDCNYAIITDAQNFTHFYFINSLKQLNSLEVVKDVTYKNTFELILGLDIWNTYYPKLVKSGANLVNKISKKHQKYGAVSGEIFTANKDFILPQEVAEINTYKKYTADKYNQILWVRVTLKKQTNDMVFIIDGAYDTSNNYHFGKGNDPQNWQHYAKVNMPYCDGAELYYPIGVTTNTNRPFYDFKLLDKVLMFIDDNDVPYTFDVKGAWDILSLATGLGEYVSSIELTYLAPLEFVSYDSTNNYCVVKPTETDVTIRELYSYNPQTQQSPIGAIPQGFITTKNRVYKNFELDAGSLTFASNKFTFNATDILTKDNIYDLCIVLKTYPYKKQGIIFDNREVVLALKYVGDISNALSVYIDKFADGYTLRYNLLNNEIVYSNSLYQIESKTHREIIPMSSSEKAAYMIANSNTLNEDIRHATASYDIQKFYGLLGGGAQMFSSLNPAGDAFSFFKGASGSLIGTASKMETIGEQYTHFNMGVQAKISDLGNMPSKISSSGAGGFNVAMFIARGMTFEEIVIKDVYSINVAIDEYLTGTLINVIDNPFANVREKYDCVKTDGYDAKCSTINKSALKAISTILNRGARKWHADKTNIPTELNPYIRNFDADWYV